MGSLRTQHKGVAIAVSEDGGGTPVSLLWFRHELHTLGFQLANGPLDIVCPESDIHLCARLQPILKVEEYDPGFRSRDAKFNPALFLVEGLIRQEPKAKLLGIESQCPVLVGNWNASELHASNHIRCCLTMIIQTAIPGRKRHMVCYAIVLCNIFRSMNTSSTFFCRI